jgi:hypothetical protein
MTRLKAVFLLLFFNVFCVAALFGKIVPLETLEQFKKEVGPLDARSLVLFDVDDTLIVPVDAVLTPKGRALIERFITERQNDNLHPFDLAFFVGRVLTMARLHLVEDYALELLQSLQHQEIKVIAFTAAESGQIGEIISFADFRVNQLQELGFNFTQAFPTFDFLTLCKTDLRKGDPLYKSGVLFSSEHPKGDILKQFLLKLELKPNQVVLVDDKMENLVSVEAAMEDMHIEFLGLHYLAAEKRSKEVDEKLALYQLKHLIEHAEWLSDEHALERLEQERPCLSFLQ